MSIVYLLPSVSTLLCYYSIYDILNVTDSNENNNNLKLYLKLDNIISILSIYSNIVYYYYLLKFNIIIISSLSLNI